MSSLEFHSKMDDNDKQVVSDSDKENEESEEEEEEVIHVLTMLDHFAIELEPTNSPLMTFCKALDVTLYRGFKMKMMTELYGDKGIGKTTFCVQLCLNVQLPMSMEGHGAESIFIDTEGSFCRQRMKVMARRFAEHCRKVSPTDFKVSVRTLMNSIHHIYCDSVKELQEILKGLHAYLKERPVKLIVIDSLAFVFYDCGDNFEGRVQNMYELCQELNMLMDKYNLAVVVTNNMTTRFHKNGRKYYIPYLGESWTHCPQQRIELVRYGKLRKANIIKCQTGYANSVYYKVTTNGIRD